MQKLPFDIWIHHLLPKLPYIQIHNLAICNSHLHQVCSTDVFWQTEYQKQYFGHMIRHPFERWNVFYGRVYTRVQEKFPNHPSLPPGTNWTQFSGVLGMSLQIPVYYPYTGHFQSKLNQTCIGKIYIISKITTFKSFLEQLEKIINQFPELKHCHTFKIGHFQTHRKDITFVYKHNTCKIQFERRKLFGRQSETSDMFVLQRETFYELIPLDIIVYLLRRFNEKEVYDIQIYNDDDSIFMDSVEIPINMLNVIILPTQRLTKKEKKKDKKRAEHALLVIDHIQTVLKKFED